MVKAKMAQDMEMEAKDILGVLDKVMMLFLVQAFLVLEEALMGVMDWMELVLVERREVQGLEMTSPPSSSPEQQLLLGPEVTEEAAGES